MSETLTPASEKRFELRARTFTGVGPEDVIKALRGERFTGRVTVDMSQGGAVSVLAEDRSHLTAEKKTT